MSTPKHIHPDIYRRLRYLAVVVVIVPLLVLAYAGAHDCRGGRVILTNVGDGPVDVALEISGSWGEATVWEGPLPKHPVHATYGRPRGHSYFSLIATDSTTGASSVHDLGYVTTRGGVHYLVVAGASVSHREGLMNYDGEADEPRWLDHLSRLYFSVIDELTCVI